MIVIRVESTSQTPYAVEACLLTSKTDLNMIYSLFHTTFLFPAVTFVCNGAFVSLVHTHIFDISTFAVKLVKWPNLYLDHNFYSVCFGPSSLIYKQN